MKTLRFFIDMRRFGEEMRHFYMEMRRFHILMLCFEEAQHYFLLTVNFKIDLSQTPCRLFGTLFL